MKRPIFSAFLRLLTVLVALSSGGIAVQAKPDFSASEITTAKESVTEGDVARFTLRLRNRGDAAADPVQLRLQWPVSGYLVDVLDAGKVRAEPDDRVTTASISLPAGAEKTVDVTVLAPRDAGGHTLTLTAQVIHFHTMAETWIHKSIVVDTRARTDGVRVGWVRIAPAGIATLAWLAATALAVVLAAWLGGGRGSRFGAPAGAIGIMIAVGFWLVFAGMAWRDYRVLYEWKPSTATIVGRRVVTQTVSSTQRRTTGTGRESRQTDVSKPEFALRYSVDGRTMFSTGYDTGSSLRTGGGRAQLEKEFREWTVGASVPCWYDPLDPADVVLKRGFGGAYIFALLPLLPFWMGWTFLRRSLARGK